MTIAIIDYGMGNLRSVEKAFHHGTVDPEPLVPEPLAVAPCAAGPA